MHVPEKVLFYFTKAHSSEKSQNYLFADCVLARKFDRSDADPKFHSTVRLQTSSDTDLRSLNSLQFIFLAPELV